MRNRVLLLSAGICCLLPSGLGAGNLATAEGSMHYFANDRAVALDLSRVMGFRVRPNADTEMAHVFIDRASTATTLPGNCIYLTVPRGPDGCIVGTRVPGRDTGFLPSSIRIVITGAGNGIVRAAAPAKDGLAYLATAPAEGYRSDLTLDETQLLAVPPDERAQYLRYIYFFCLLGGRYAKGSIAVTDVRLDRFINYSVGVRLLFQVDGSRECGGR